MVVVAVMGVVMVCRGGDDGRGGGGCDGGRVDWFKPMV